MNRISRAKTKINIEMFRKKCKRLSSSPLGKQLNCEINDFPLSYLWNFVPATLSDVYRHWWWTSLKLLSTLFCFIDWLFLSRDRLEKWRNRKFTILSRNFQISFANEQVPRHLCHFRLSTRSKSSLTHNHSYFWFIVKACGKYFNEL